VALRYTSAEIATILDARKVWLRPITGVAALQTRLPRTGDSALNSGFALVCDPLLRLIQLQHRLQVEKQERFRHRASS
jgi:hypothetical protein